MILNLGKLMSSDKDSSGSSNWDAPSNKND